VSSRLEPLRYVDMDRPFIKTMSCYVVHARSKFEKPKRRKSDRSRHTSRIAGLLVRSGLHSPLASVFMKWLVSVCVLPFRFGQMSYQYPQYPGYGVQPPSATSDLLASILARTSPAPTMGFPPTIAPIQPFQLPSFAAPSALPSTSTFLSAPPAPAPISNGVADAQARAVAAFAQRLPSHSRQASVEMEGLFASRPPQRFDPMPAPAPNPVALNSFPIDQFMSAQRAAATPVIEAPSPELSSFEQFLKARIATSRNSDTPFESGSGSGSSTPIGTAVDTKPQTKVTNSRSVFARRPSSSSSSSAMPHKPAPSQPHMHTAVPPSSAAHSVQPPFSAISNQLPSASAPPAHLAYLFGSNSTDALSHIDHDSSSARRARLMAAAAAEVHYFDFFILPCSLVIFQT
jgi:hypothetical protein